MEEVKKIKAQLRQPVAYRHITRDANTVADDMARRALEAKTDIVYWDGQVPDDAPPNQLPDIYQIIGLDRSPQRLEATHFIYRYPKDRYSQLWPKTDRRRRPLRVPNGSPKSLEPAYQDY
jgi:hypothetical protein